MAITYPLSIPTHTGIRSYELRATNAIAYSASPFHVCGDVLRIPWQSLDARHHSPTNETRGRRDLDLLADFAERSKGLFTPAISRLSRLEDLRAMLTPRRSTERFRLGLSVDRQRAGFKD